MKEKLRFIALRVVKVNDTTSILEGYSREKGVVSILLKLSQSKESMRRHRVLQPPAIIECTGESRPAKQFTYISEPIPMIAIERIYSNPIRNALAIFTTELLGILLHEQGPDERLFDFIFSSIETLVKQPVSKIANFHIAFMRQLAFFLGIEPDFGSYITGARFDMDAASFRQATLWDNPGNLRPETESLFISKLHRINFRNMHLYRLTRDQRNATTDVMLQYFTLHYAKANAMKSLPILRSLL